MSKVLAVYWLFWLLSSKVITACRYDPGLKVNQTPCTGMVPEIEVGASTVAHELVYSADVAVPPTTVKLIAAALEHRSLAGGVQIAPQMSVSWYVPSEVPEPFTAIQ